MENKIKRRPRIDSMSKKAQKALDRLASLDDVDPKLMKKILKTAKKFSNA